MTVPAWSIAPFVLMLATIAIAPLVPALARIWERPRNQLIFSLLLGIPVAVLVLIVGEGELVTHAVVEYTQFIILLFALFSVSGGIFLRGDIAATPRTNTIFLAIGGVLASFIGTTGAAMLLIRPLLNTNAERKHKAHTVVFSIFIVANCGGLLTPLGDPPLFLGMLRGVPFEWTFTLTPEWAFTNGMLLLTYWALDRRIVAHESPEDVLVDRTQTEPLRLAGGSNFVWFDRTRRGPAPRAGVGALAGDRHARRGLLLPGVGRQEGAVRGQPVHVRAHPGGRRDLRGDLPDHGPRPRGTAGVRPPSAPERDHPVRRHGRPQLRVGQRPHVRDLLRDGLPTGR
jgi:hypothetical protein